MARSTARSTTVSGSSMGYGPSSRATSRLRTYNWPPLQLNFWILVMLLASSSILGVFGGFIRSQTQLNLGIPWYWPYFMTVSCLTILYIVGLFYLIANRRLLPAIVMIGAFILWILWSVGLIVTAIELFGPSGAISSNCDMEVFSRYPQGPTEEVLAWLMQRSICESWRLVFAMALIGTLFLVWIMIMSYQVFANS